MTNIELYFKQLKMMNTFLETGAMSIREYEKSMGGLTEKMGFLIKDTTKEQREQIVEEALGNMAGGCDGCMPRLAEMYQQYIDGEKELRDINMEFNARYVSGADAPEKGECGYIR